MKKKAKFLLIGVIGVSSFCILIFFGFFIIPMIQSSNNNKIENRSELLFEVTNITIIIDYSDVKDSEIFKNINLTNFKTTAFHALLNCCDVVAQDHGWGIYVKQINGVGEGWIYTVNNESLPNIPSNLFNLIDNDIVKWTHV